MQAGVEVLAKFAGRGGILRSGTEAVGNGLRAPQDCHALEFAQRGGEETLGFSECPKLQLCSREVLLGFRGIEEGESQKLLKPLSF